MAHENGAIEGPHGHLKRCVADALALRGSADFNDLDSYRRFIAEVIGRANAHRSRAFEAERATLGDLPAVRTADYEPISVHVTSSSGFVLRRVFYTVPSRLIGHRLGGRVYDNRIELFLSGTHLLTLPRGRAGADAGVQVVNYRHVIHSLKKKPMALLNLVYRDQLFPREAYRRCFERALEWLPERQACRPRGGAAGASARGELRRRTGRGDRPCAAGRPAARSRRAQGPRRTAVRHHARRRRRHAAARRLRAWSSPVWG